MDSEEIGTVISGPEGPSPSELDLVVHSGKLHRGQYVEMDYSEGTMVCLVTNVYKTNRYFERFESVKEFESSGFKLFEQFPAGEWEYLVAKTRPLGVYHGGLIKRATFPPSPGTKVRVAEKSTLENFLGFDLEKGLLLGEIEHHNVPVKLNLSRLFQKHLAILAMSGAGKCANYHSKVMLEGSEQVKIGQLVDSVLEKNKLFEDGVEFWKADLGHRAYALNEEKIGPAKVLGYYRRKSPDTLVHIKTRSGKSLEVTREHLVPIFSGCLEWKEAQNLRENDYLFLPRLDWVGKPAAIDFTEIASKFDGVIIVNGCALQKKSKISTPLVHKVDEQLARVFAYLLAEGHNTLKSRINFTNSSPKIQSDFTEIINEKFALSVKKAKSKGELLVDSVVLARCLERFGFTNSSWTKFVPAQILQSEKSVLKSFISAFIDCDGYVNPKKPEINITLASVSLADGIEEMLAKLGTVPFRKIKRVQGKEYQMVIISGSGEIKKLGDLNLLIDYKKSALEKWANTKANTNVDVVPNLNNHLRETISLLRMPQPQSELAGVANYLSRRDNPSRESLAVLLGVFEKRANEVECALTEINSLYANLPKTSEGAAAEIVKSAYAAGLNFKTIARGSGVSSTTARRLARGVTAPAASAFLLAKNSLTLQGKSDLLLDLASSIDGNKVLSDIKRLCETLGCSSEELSSSAGVYEQFLYSHSTGRGVPEFSKILLLAGNLKSISGKISENLMHARAKIRVIKHFSGLNAFFDKVKSVEIVKSTEKYVYDLSVEGSNFAANGILVHNSYLVSVLLEELLQRKKEDGRIGVIVMDAHGEYRSFAEPVQDRHSTDFSSKTKYVRATEVQIGVPKLSPSMMAMMVPGISAPQKRDLGKIFEKLRREMKGGLGPFDFGAVKSEIMKDAEIKQGTKEALISWILTLEQMRLFGKTDNPSIGDLVRPGQLTIVDLSDIVELKKKQVIVAYFARKLFDERRSKRVPPFTMVVEESHQFAPEKAPKEGSISKYAIETIAREGRKFGAGICLVSQRPKHLSTTSLSQANTHIILRVTNPYDLDHIKQTSEGIDQRSLDMITSLRTGEALIVGEAVNYPVFFKVRKKSSQDSRHESTLEKSAVDFEEAREAVEKDAEDLL